MNNSQVAHLWANRSKSHANGSNFFFHDASIYSYGYHFEVARLVTTEKGETIALFNASSYSSSTSKHQCHASSACYSLHETFDVPTFLGSEKGDFKKAIERFQAIALDYYGKAKRARTYGDHYLECAEDALAKARRL